MRPYRDVEVSNDQDEDCRALGRHISSVTQMVARKESGCSRRRGTMEVEHGNKISRGQDEALVVSAAGRLRCVPMAVVLVLRG